MTPKHGMYVVRTEEEEEEERALQPVSRNEAVQEHWKSVRKVWHSAEGVKSVRLTCRY